MNRRDVLKLAAVSPVALISMPVPDSGWLVEKVHRLDMELRKAGLHRLHPVYRLGSLNAGCLGVAGLSCVEPNQDFCSAEIRLYRADLNSGGGVERTFVKELAVDMQFCSRLDRVAFYVIRQLTEMDWVEISLDRNESALTPVVF